MILSPSIEYRVTLIHIGGDDNDDDFMVLFNCTVLSYAVIWQHSVGSNMAPHAMSLLPLNLLGSVLTISCNPGQSRYRSCHQ